MNKNKMLASIMCASTLMTSVFPVFATQTLTNETLDQKQETEVLYSKSATYTITIPKQITLGEDKTSTYSVKVEGDISSDTEVYVAPVDAISETDNIDFYMEDQSKVNKKDNVIATVTPTKTNWNFEEVANSTEVTDNSIEAKDLTSGTWKGTFNFEINLNSLSEEAVALEAGLYDADGVMLCTWEESGINDTCSNAKTIINDTYSTATKVVLPTNITQIGTKAFENCTNLTSIIIPNSITTIGQFAFAGCSSLTNLTIPNSVTEIKQSAFYNCTNLTNVTFGTGLTNIEVYAFYDCNNLTNVTFEDTTTWYVGNSDGATTTQIDVTDSSINATNLKSTYSEKYLTKTE